MAVNEKPIYATELVSGEGNRLPYKPGERIDGRLRPDVVKGLQERGLATDSASQAKAAEAHEADRQAHVVEQIEGRSEPSETSRKLKRD